jgi:hypothetical protein
MFGCWPSQLIDHANRDPSDNRLVNFRDASERQNQYNRGAWKNKPSALPKGVYRTASTGRFISHIRVEGKSKHLGTFDTVEEAQLAYMAAARKLYGEYANSGLSREPAWTMNMMLSFGC